MELIIFSVISLVLSVISLVVALRIAYLREQEYKDKKNHKNVK